MSNSHTQTKEITARVEQLVKTYGDDKASTAFLLCDKYPSHQVAYRIIAKDGSIRSLTYGELRTRSEKLADGFAKLGIKPGDRIATLMSKGEDFLICLLTIWRMGAVHVPLFTAFASPAIELRLKSSGAKMIVCDHAQRPKLDDIVGKTLPDIMVAIDDVRADGDLSLPQIEESGEPGFVANVGGGDATVIEIYTSGTTGTPKGVGVPLRALAGFQGYGEFGLGLRPDDVFWNSADPGWGYGLYFGVIAVLSTGVLGIMHADKFSPEGTIGVLVDQKVTNFAAAPTVYRSLRSSGIAMPSIKLRCASSAGEPLTPEVNEWAPDALGAEVHDHFGQTESGMLVCNHHHPALGCPIRPGSMGQPAPGWKVKVIDPETFELLGVNQPGALAVELADSPFAWFNGYIGAPEKNNERLTPDGKWFLTGDVAQYDEDGYLYFSARKDDVIIMAGYRIGPFEVESVLSTHPAVAECAVVAVPDEVRGEVLEAAVVLANGFEQSDALVEELKKKVKTEFAAHAYPRRIHFRASLPKTPSGKIQRFIVRDELRGEMEQTDAD